MRENGTQGRALRLFRAFPALLYRRWTNQANSRFSRPFAAKDFYLRLSAQICGRTEIGKVRLI
jgi:hypothetical protein